MIVKVTHKNKAYELLLGFEVLKKMTECIAKGLTELDMIAELGFAAINTMRKRKGEDPLPEAEFYDMMDDLDFFVAVQNAVETFSENFTAAAEKIKKPKK